MYEACLFLFPLSCEFSLWNVGLWRKNTWSNLKPWLFGDPYFILFIIIPIKLGIMIIPHENNKFLKGSNSGGGGYVEVNSGGIQLEAPFQIGWIGWWNAEPSVFFWPPVFQIELDKKPTRFLKGIIPNWNLAISRWLAIGVQVCIYSDGHELKSFWNYSDVRGPHPGWWVSRGSLSQLAKYINVYIYIYSIYTHISIYIYIWEPS